MALIYILSIRVIILSVLSINVQNSTGKKQTKSCLKDIDKNGEISPYETYYDDVNCSKV